MILVEETQQDYRHVLILQISCKPEQATRDGHTINNVSRLIV